MNKIPCVPTIVMNSSNKCERNSLRLVLFALSAYIPLAFLLTGCNSTPELTEKQMMTTRMGDTTAVEIMDMRSVVRNNVLTAQVSVKNWGPKPDKSGEEQTDTKLYSYRFKWLNANGMVVFSDEAWKPLTLTRDQSADLLGVAPNPDATAFRFEIHQYR